MAATRIFTSSLCLIVALVGSTLAQTTLKPDELRYRGDNTNTNTNDNAVIPNGNQNPLNNQNQNTNNLVTPTNNNNMDNNQLRLSSTTQASTFEDGEADGDEEDNNQQGLFNPFNFFNPRPQPYNNNNNNNNGFQRRPSSLFDLFGGGLSRFRELEKQANQGDEVSYYSLNGVSYMRTCTTKRV